MSLNELITDCLNERKGHGGRSLKFPCAMWKRGGGRLEESLFEKIVANANFFPELRLDLKATVTMAKTG